MNHLSKIHDRFWSRTRRTRRGKSFRRRILPEPLEDRRLLATLAGDVGPVEAGPEPAVIAAAEVRAIPAPAPVTADFNSDGAMDANDIDALIGEIGDGTHHSRYDLTGDGRVDLDDRDEWLVRAGAANLPSGDPYLLGDATLDGVVDVSDMNVLNAHMFTHVDGYSSADFNADGVVDVSDWNVLNANMFQASIQPDFNHDGASDIRDIDALLGEIVAGTDDPAFDLNLDGRVDLGDRNEWLARAGEENLPSGQPYLLGDANLDGVVDVSDLNVLRAHMFTEATGYSSGDFNADGVVDVSDWNIVNASFFTSSAGTEGGNDGSSNPHIVDEVMARF